MIRRIVITSACVAVAAFGPAALASAESLSGAYAAEGLITSLAADPYPPGTVVTHSSHETDSDSSSDDAGSSAGGGAGGAAGAASGGVSVSKSESRTNGHKNHH